MRWRRSGFAALAGVAVALMAAPGSAQELPVPDRDPETVRRLADEILSRHEFQIPQPSIFERIQQWLAEQAGRLIGNLVGGGGSLVSWLLLLAAATALAWLVARFTRSVQADPGVRPTVEVDRRRTGADWRAEAEGHEAAGEWKAALRARYRALIADLVLRRLVQDVPGRTSGEYRTDVAIALPAGAPAFAGATELFERAWYGDRPTGEAENRQFRALADDVLESSGS